MRRDRLDVAFTVFLLLVVAWAVYEARNWDLRARLFPWAIGIPVLILVLVQLTGAVRAALSSSDTLAGTTEIYGDTEPGVALRRTLMIVGWLIGFAVAIWAFGFAYGGTLGTLLYLRFSSREKWWVCLAMSAGTAAFFWIMTTFLHVPFPRGAVLEMMGF